MKLTVEPEMLHTELLGESIENVTGSVEVASAVTLYVAPPTVASIGGIEVKAIDCVLFGSVLNVSSAPVLEPPMLAAEIRKWYSVLALRPEIMPETATLLVPAPGAGVQGTLEVYGMVVPYSSLHSVTSKPLGLTSPLSVALVVAIELAGSVLTVGLTGAPLLALNSAWAPPAVRPAFVVAVS